MRASQPFGESGADPRDLKPEYADLFRRVDQTAGDTLLGMFWWNEPPSAWWT